MGGAFANMSPRDDTAPSLLAESLRHIEVEAPRSYRALCEALRDRQVACHIEGDGFTLRSDGRRVWLMGPAEGVTVRLQATLRGLMDLLDGRLDLVESLRAGTVAMWASLEEAEWLEEAIRAYVHGAAMAPSCADLGERLRDVRGDLNSVKNDGFGPNEDPAGRR